MAIDSNQLDSWINSGIDLKGRKLYFGPDDEGGGGFDWKSVEKMIRAIHILETEAPTKPIELHMSSSGGDPYDMLRLVDIIEHSPCQFKFIGSGRIMSAATWVMAVCDERFLHKNTIVLLHDSPSFAEENNKPIKLTDNKIDYEEEERMQKMLNKLYADNSRMPEEFYNVIVKRDCYLSAEEVVQLGLADKIIEPKKRGNLRRMRIALLNKEVDKAELAKVVRKIYSRINESKLPTKIEIHTPHEKFDSKVFVEKEIKEEQKEKPAEQGVQLAEPVVAAFND